MRVNVGPSPFTIQHEPYIVVDQLGRLFVGWNAGLPIASSTEFFPVGFSRSLDGGLTWFNTTFMPFINEPAGRFQRDPWLTVDERGRLYFSRLEFNFGGFLAFSPQYVVVSRSDDGGATWSQTANAQTNTNHFSDKDSIISDSNGTLYVAYSDVGPSNAPGENILVTTSRDGGLTWTPATTVTDDGMGNPLGAVMAAQPNGVVHIAWLRLLDGNIISDTSLDRGQTWGRDVRVSDVPGTVNLGFPFVPFGLPSIVENSKGTLFVAWPDFRNGNRDIFVSSSSDGGKTWSPAVRVNDDKTSRDQFEPTLAIDAFDKLHLTWVDNRTGNFNIFYSTSKDGKTWSKNERVTDAETPNSRLPFDYNGLVTDKQGNVFAVWTDGRNGNFDIYFARRSSTTGPVVLSISQEFLVLVPGNRNLLVSGPTFLRSGRP